MPGTDDGLQPSPADAEAYDVIIVGAGAAGLLAASRAAERDRRTLLLERNRKPGVKILISGGTRCNLTHAGDRRSIVEGFGSSGPFLHSPLFRLGPRELVELFEAEGVPTYVEAETGKMFPRSNRAADVVEALVRRLQRSGAELALDEPVTAVERCDAGFRVVTARRTLVGRKLLLAVGGKSYPGCGTVGDGYAWLAALGHTIRRPRPALVPLVSDDAWVRALSGIALRNVDVRVVDRAAAGGVLIRRRGDLLFTHFGLSGPAALDVSRAVSGCDDPRRLRVEVDCLPDVDVAELDERLHRTAADDGRRQLVGTLDERLPRRVVEAAFAQAGVPLERRAAELSRTERAALVDALKRLTIGVSGTRGFAKAEVTAGGVALDEVDSRTMESKLVPGLYLAGEILDLDGFIGGYNFQAAFSTGWTAAEAM